MIRSEHSIVRYDFLQREALPDRLLKTRDAAYVDVMAECIAVYQQGIGRVRQELHGEVEVLLSEMPGCPPRRVAAFCKLLDDAGRFAESTGKAAAFRRRVFEIAAPLHPVVQFREGVFEHAVDDARQRLETELKLTWEQIEDRMFDDVIELQKLQQFPDSLAAELILARYNLVQTQAALYRATTVCLELFSQAPYVLKQAKLAGLMHRVTHFTESNGAKRHGYRIVLDGPASTLRDTTRYGIGFAKMLPALLTCDDWRLVAQVIGPQQRLFKLQLSPADRLRSEVTGPDEFDSELELQIAKQWQAAPVSDWQLARDQEFLVIHQEIFTPDFVLTHRDGQKIYIEVVGYWTPEYLQEKQQRLKRFADQSGKKTRWLLMLDRTAARSKEAWLQSLGLPVVLISKSLKPEDWIRAVLDPQSPSHEPNRVTV